MFMTSADGKILLESPGFTEGIMIHFNKSFHCCKGYEEYGQVSHG
jgi:hypothetical protein